MRLINALLLVAFLGTTVYAQHPIQREEMKRDRTALIDQNIAANLHSDNLGVQASTIQLIIDMSKAEPKKDLDYAVIPLLDLLKTSKHEEVRILAALGLYHLDSDLGQFAVSRRVEYDDSQRVANMCKRIANAWQTGEESPATNYAYTTVDDIQ